MDEIAARRASAVRAASKSLAPLLDDSAALSLIRSDDSLPDRSDYRELARSWMAGGGQSELRRNKRLRLLEIAARDLAGELDLVEVGRALSDLADACLEATLQHLEASDSLCIISMGKLGGRELNYSSDIDLMFVSDDDLERATKAAGDLVELLGGFAPEGQAFRIDLNLRPEGRNGPVVRSLEGYLEYYRRWAQTWEFQALIKARPCAGDLELGKTFMEATRALVYPSEVSSEGIENIRKMKERVEEHATRSARKGRSSEANDVKLGPGGIRDIEFSVQLLQLVHGGGDPAVRSGSTLDAIRALVEGGYVAEDDGAGLSVDYRWLRNVEHRVQLWQERQVHALPNDEEDRSRIARTMGFNDSPSASALSRFDDAHARVLADVRGRFEKLFYRPMVESLADPAGPGLTHEALTDRLRILGFRDVERAARTLSGLVQGSSRRAKLFRVLTPALLRSLSGTPLPDEGLFAFLRLGDALEARPDLLGSLRDNPPGIEFLARVLGSGRILGEVLEHVPEELSAISDPAGPYPPKDRDRLVREALASLRWRDPDRRFDGLRRFKRREMLHVALADIGGASNVRAIGHGLSDLADACVTAALEEVEIPFAVIGMGKLGGRELNYSSDIDVMFVHGGSHEEGERAAEYLMRSIGEVTPEGQAFRMDAALRPEGKSGPLARSIESYGEYYRRWAQPWERLALIKARVTAGDEELGARFLAMAEPQAYPERVADEAIAEIRHLKARMERERVPRGTDPRRHIKLGPGGLSDVEFAVQVLQMTHGHLVPELRVTNTLDALDAAFSQGLLEADARDRLRAAYAFLMKLRNRLFFIQGRPGDGLPVRQEELAALGISMGFTSHPRQEVEEEYLRVTRRTRKVAEGLIYG